MDRVSMVLSHDGLERSDELVQQLQAGLESLGLLLKSEQQQRLLLHLALVFRWNRVYNLTAVRDLPSMLTHHVLDSVAAVPAVASALASFANPNVLDVGSGAGFPGVPFAIALPHCAVTCIDKVGKKAGFVQDVCNRLALRNLQAVHARVETLKSKPWQLVTSRAFASLADFVSLTRHLIAPDGCWMALKAHVEDAELAAVRPLVDVFHVEQLQVPSLNAARCLVWMRPHRID